MELADKDVQSLQPNSHAPVHKLNEPQLSAQRNTRSNPQCHREGKHSASTCFKTEQCHVCVVNLAIFQEYAVIDNRIRVEGMDTLLM